MSSDKKWKTGLLKSGLPLEYVTARTLSELGYQMLGEYPYMRAAESGGEKEFSVDIRAHKLFKDGERLHTLNLLIECKYRQPGTSWIFAEYLADFHAIGLVQTPPFAAMRPSRRFMEALPKLARDFVSWDWMACSTPSKVEAVRVACRSALSVHD